MKLELNNLPAKLGGIANVFRRYIVVIFLIIVCGIYGFLTYRINSLTQSEPTSSSVSEQLKAVTRLRVDEDAVDRMLKLEQENIEIQALFEEARNNPFSE